MNTNIFKEILTESEIDILTKLQEKIKSKLSEPISEADENNALEDIDTSSPYAFDDVNTPNHFSEENRELIFYVRAEVSTIDKKKNQYLSLDHCLDESFHIPIPSGTNLADKVGEFMSVFETNLVGLAEKLNKQQDGKI